MKLTIDEIIQATEGQLLSGTAQDLLHGVSTDSRSVSPGSLFIPLKGPNFDGHDYIEDAFRQGARAALVQQGSTAAQT
ncbi:MAG: UDP-N-acetylmuramoyl-tripeptide--D-alanyl-D-alanine ligase, partial [Deltaproteobacteria bacterium]|nr:UDP-N-acetylmuramoyl-tripeptide--D-alanyl-D-alanine ligase [Deltaproteobacteria bacterium]